MKKMVTFAVRKRTLNNMRKRRTAKQWVLIVTRLLLGHAFIFSGFAKGVDVVGMQIKLTEYMESFGFHQADWFVIPTSFILPVLEYASGVALLLGNFKFLSALIILIFMGIFTPLTLYIALTSPVMDCGCFGDAFKLSNWETFFKNLFLLPLAILALKWRNLRVFEKARNVRLGINLLSLIIFLSIEIYGYNHLPIIDFRPYKVGVNLTEAMSFPEDEPPIQNFVIQSMKPEDDHYDYANQMLSADFPFLIVASPTLTKFELSVLPKLKELTQQGGVMVIMLTGSSEEEVKAFQEVHQFMENFYFCDAIPLKTMIRSNPGFVLIKKGTILKKWHYNDMPMIEEISKLVKKEETVPLTE